MKRKGKNSNKLRSRSNSISSNDEKFEQKTSKNVVPDISEDESDSEKETQSKNIVQHEEGKFFHLPISLEHFDSTLD